MEQLIIGGHIPFTNLQISFSLYAIVVSSGVALWFYHSLIVHLRQPEPVLPPTISPDF